MRLRPLLLSTLFSRKRCLCQVRLRNLAARLPVLFKVHTCLASHTLPPCRMLLSSFEDMDSRTSELVAKML
eukprot:1832962-Amphidinium_carterae.1